MGAGCGSDDPEEAPPPPPSIPAASAARLAGISDKIAAELDAGDLCTAAEHADELSDAIEKARLPERFNEVETVATELVNEVNCPPPPEPEKPKKDEEKKKDEKGGDKESYEDAELPGPGDLPPGQAKKLGFD